MSSLFAAVTNEEISQIIEEAVPNKQEEGDEIQFRIFCTCLFNLNLSMKPVNKFYVSKRTLSLALLRLVNMYIKN